jgi:hypothetical protein
MARRDGELVAGITAFADGPDEMREVIQRHAKMGVDNVKLSMSGEEVSCDSMLTITPSAELTMLARSPRFVPLRIVISPMKRQLLVSTKRINMVFVSVHMPELVIRSRCVGRKADMTRRRLLMSLCRCSTWCRSHLSCLIHRRRR